MVDSHLQKDFIKHYATDVIAENMQMLAESHLPTVRRKNDAR